MLTTFDCAQYQRLTTTGTGLLGVRVVLGLDTFFDIGDVCFVGLPIGRQSTRFDGTFDGAYLRWVQDGRLLAANIR